MPRPFPRHRRAGLAALAVALVATVLPLQSRIASAREVDRAGQTPWRAVVASVLPTPLRSQETVRIAFSAAFAQSASSFSSRCTISSTVGALKQWSMSARCGCRV